MQVCVEASVASDIRQTGHKVDRVSSRTLYCRMMETMARCSTGEERGDIRGIAPICNDRTIAIGHLLLSCRTQELHSNNFPYCSYRSDGRKAGKAEFAVR